MGRTCDGQLFHAGGWGPILSDQGAGSRIGLLALRAIFHAMDASEATSLLPALHTAWKTNSVEELVDLGNRIPVVEFSLLAPMVAKSAAEGDVIARRVLQQSGEELADLVLLAMRKGTSLESPASAYLSNLFCALDSRLYRKCHRTNFFAARKDDRDHPPRQSCRAIFIATGRPPFRRVVARRAYFYSVMSILSQRFQAESSPC